MSIHVEYKLYVAVYLLAGNDNHVYGMHSRLMHTVTSTVWVMHHGIHESFKGETTLFTLRLKFCTIL